MALEKDPGHLMVRTKSVTMRYFSVLKKRSQSYTVHVSTIDKRQRGWLGHTLRHGDLLRIVIEGRVEGRRPPGRLRTGNTGQNQEWQLLPIN